MIKYLLNTQSVIQPGVKNKLLQQQGRKEKYSVLTKITELSFENISVLKTKKYKNLLNSKEKKTKIPKNNFKNTEIKKQLLER